MHVSLTNAKAQLTELVRRAEAGDEVILTRHGQAAVRLVPIRPPVDMEARRRVLEEVMESAARDKTPGPTGAELQEALYNEDGLPA